LSASRLPAGVSSLPRAMRMDATAMVDGRCSTELIAANEDQLRQRSYSMERKEMHGRGKKEQPLIAAKTHSTARTRIARRSSSRNRAAKQLM